MPVKPNVLQKLILRDTFLTKFLPLGPNLPAGLYTTSAEITKMWNIADFLLNFANLADLSTVLQIRLKVNNETIRQWVTTDGAVGFDLDLINGYDLIPDFASTGSVLLLSMQRSALRGGTEAIDWGLPVAANGTFELGSGVLQRVPTLFSGSPKDLSYETTLNCGSVGPDGLKITSVVLEIDFASTGPTPPDISLYARVMPPADGGPGTILRTNYDVFNCVQGTNTMSKNKGLLLGNPLYEYLDRLYLVTPAGLTLDNFFIQYNGGIQIQRTDAVNRFQQSRYGKAPGATVYVLDFREEGWGDTPLHISYDTDDLQIQFTASAGGGLGNYQECLGSAQAAR